MSCDEFEKGLEAGIVGNVEPWATKWSGEDNGGEQWDRSSQLSPSGQVSYTGFQQCRKGAGPIKPSGMNRRENSANLEKSRKDFQENRELKKIDIDNSPTDQKVEGDRRRGCDYVGTDSVSGEEKIAMCRALRSAIRCDGTPQLGQSSSAAATPTSYSSRLYSTKSENIRLKAGGMPKLWGLFAGGLDPTKIPRMLPFGGIWKTVFLFVQ